MVEENQREDDGKGNPEGELLVDRHAREGVEEKEASHGDGDRRRIVEVNRADTSPTGVEPFTWSRV